MTFSLCHHLAVIYDWWVEVFVVAGVQAGTCSQRSSTSAISIGNTSEERQSICPTLTERGKIWSSIWIIQVLVSYWAWWSFSIRMNKNRFEEDDGIDMNDIERFLPHLRSVSQIFFFPLVKWNLVFVEYPASLGPWSIYWLFNTAPCWHNGWITLRWKKHDVSKKV